MRKIYETTTGSHRYAVHYSTEWQEYRVRLYANGIAYPAADYFTSDKADAIDTAIAFAARQERIDQQLSNIKEAHA